MYAEWLKAATYIVALSKRGKRRDRTHRNAILLRQGCGKTLRDFRDRLIVDHIARLNIEKYARRHSLAKQFDRAGRSNRRFSRQHNDGVGVLGGIHHQEASGLTAEGNQHEEQDKSYTDSHRLECY